jgi:hypothetical protein
MADPRGPCVCVRGIMFKDGTATMQVIYTGSRINCEALADDEPPDSSVDPANIRDQLFVVRSAREWSELMGECGGSAPEAVARWRADA